MKKILTLTIGALCATTILAAETAGTKKPTKRELRERRIAAAGGFVVRPYAGKKIVIVNDQKRVAEKDFFKDRQSSIEGLLGYPVQVVPAKSDVSKAAVVITLSDDDSAPSLLVAPEVPWAGINVGALAVDSPKPEVLASRLQKEIWRAFMYACGAANSVMQPCVMRTVRRPQDLDAHVISVPCPDSLPRVANTAKELGIGETSICTYKQACMEGWAPAPTNDVQKAVWQEVHSMPKSPMKIKFDPAAQKGKVTK